jgi:hypothetical protein
MPSFRKPVVRKPAPVLAGAPVPRVSSSVPAKFAFWLSALAEAKLLTGKVQVAITSAEATEATATTTNAINSFFISVSFSFLFFNLNFIEKNFLSNHRLRL